MKTLSRKDIQRMVDTGSLSIGGKRRSSSGGGGGGGVSSTWVEDNFISKDFFNELLVIKGTKTTTVGSGQPVVEDYTFEPNEVPGTTQTTEGGVTTTVVTAITNIEVGDSSQNKGIGLWTSKFLSALGMNPSGGGGGGGSSTLAGLNDVALYPDPLTPANANDVLTYNGNGHWVNTSKSSFLSGYATTSDISDMATQTWVLGRGYITGISSTDVTTALGYTPLNSATTFWGQSVSNGVVSGSLTNVGNITSNTNGSIYSFSAIEFGTASNSGNGGALYFHFPGVVGHASSYIIEQSEGVLSLLGAPPTGGNFGVVVGNANGTYLQIGDIRLVYDSTNNALKIVTSNNEAANLYATGSVSALGMSAGTSSVDAMTFNYVTINNELRLKNGPYTGSVFVNSNHNLCLSSSGVIGTLGNKLYTEGGGIDTEDGDINAGGGTIITTGNVQATRFYLDGTRYLYVSGGTLYYYNGTTSKQVAFTN